MKLRCIVDNPRNCQSNMAIDEMFFIKEPFESVFRFYTWSEPGFTIGYFQKKADIENKNNYPLVRRMTAGLAVFHDIDLSYSLTVSDDIWPYVYNQEETYRIIHNEIKNALKEINIVCDEQKKIDTAHKDISCIKTFYKDDLFLNGRKLVGSCQRRRGKRLLVEGSIHIKLNEEQINIFANKFFENISKNLKCDIERNVLNNCEIASAADIADMKYNTEKWNGLF
ncbi:MAG: biotin/lipoate A/B protein ligase family protein [Endomicrobiaceae bacterium]